LQVKVTLTCCYRTQYVMF